MNKLEPLQVTITERKRRPAVNLVILVTSILGALCIFGLIITDFVAHGSSAPKACYDSPGNSRPEFCKEKDWKNTKIECDLDQDYELECKVKSGGRIKCEVESKKLKEVFYCKVMSGCQVSCSQSELQKLYPLFKTTEQLELIQQALNSWKPVTEE